MATEIYCILVKRVIDKLLPGIWVAAGVLGVVFTLKNTVFVYHPAALLTYIGGQYHRRVLIVIIVVVNITNIVQ